MYYRRLTAAVFKGGMSGFSQPELIAARIFRREWKGDIILPELLESLIDNPYAVRIAWEQVARLGANLRVEDYINFISLCGFIPRVALEASEWFAGIQDDCPLMVEARKLSEFDDSLSKERKGLILVHLAEKLQT